MEVAMHEMSLMSSVFDVINTTLEKHIEVEKVLRVKLKVGEFTNAQPSALEFAFQAFAQGTKVEGAVFELEILPVIARCTKCNHEFEIKGIAFCCTQCKDYGIEIISGRELLLESLEVE
jgi:hydrogenase nickel incorporation protein HypA/HybF